MEDQERIKWPGVLREFFSAIISIITFWAITFFWNAAFVELGIVPRLGLGAALSWVVFLHAEVMGMILMSMMRRRERAEARAEGRAEGRKEAEAEAREIIRDLERQLREARGEGSNDA